MKITIPYKALSALIILLSLNTTFGQTLEERQELVNKIQSKEATNFTREVELYQQQQNDAVKKLIKKGVPSKVTSKNGSVGVLRGVSSNGAPIYYYSENETVAVATGARALNTGGSLGLNLNGEGMIAYVWDNGRARRTHQEFNIRGKIGQVDDNTTYGNPGDLNSQSFHANLVIGSVAARGINPAAKGMAPLAQIRAYVSDNDLVELDAAAKDNGALVSNQSYGTPVSAAPEWQLGGYSANSYVYDGIINSKRFILPVTSAGNGGSDNTSNSQPLEGNGAYDKLSNQKTAKNTLVVANGEFDMTATSGFKVHPSSSQGPTDDLRIKPDITAIGTNIISPSATTDSSYGTYTGTSIAAPAVAGNLLLLQQHSKNVFGGFLQAMTLKGLVLHTATDDIPNSGPDAKSGWGLINSKKAAQVITAADVSAVLDEKRMTDTSGDYSFTVISDGTKPLIASISWSDLQEQSDINTSEIVNSATKVLTHDLDLRIIKDGITYYPWRLTSVTTNANDGDNNTDPFERIDIMNPTAGTYTVTVSKKGTITGTEHYAVIVTGAGTTLSTKNFSSEDVKIYPNPATNLLNVSFRKANEDILLTIRDIQGRNVFNKNYKTTSNIFSKQLDLSSLSDGVYMLSINNDGNIVNKKIIKK